MLTKNKMKKLFFYGFIVFMILIMVSGVFGYKKLCLKEGQYVPLPPNDPTYICGYARCDICVDDDYFPTSPARCNKIRGCEELGEDGEILPLSMVVDKPDEKVYEDNKVILDVDLSKPAMLYYILDDDKEKKACSRCSSYKKEKRMKDGEHNITFRSVYEDEEIIGSVIFEVDSKKPKIKEISPERDFANGKFTVEYDELNLKEVRLYYGENTLNVVERTDCPSGKKQTCDFEVNLNNFSEVFYYFELEDNFRTVRSETIILDVDLGKPILTTNTFDDLYPDKKVEFELFVNEDVDLLYYDYGTEKEKKSCSKCDYYNKKISFNDGYYDLDIIARDKAGNEDRKHVSFAVDSRKPKIRKIEPRRGFANGEFRIEYDEINLDGISLFYNGNEKVLSCDSGYKKECVANVNLNGFTEVNYYFVVRDSFYAVSSKVYTLEVDVEAPVFDKFEKIIDGKYVYFDIEVSEEVDLEYKDTLDKKPRWRTLKKGVDSYEGRKSFKKGSHDVIVRGLDEAENVVIETFSFVV